jgi:F0F1-type ATP synthase epsilon subunit
MVLLVRNVATWLVTTPEGRKVLATSAAAASDVYQKRRAKAKAKAQKGRKRRKRRVVKGKR